MTAFSELTGTERTVELLRWIGVLPVAALGGLAARYASGLVWRLAVYGWGGPAESEFVYFLQLLLHFPQEAAIVIAGAKMAPRSRLATAIALAVVGIVMSLITHVLGQANPGITNYSHFAVESIGAVLGVAYIHHSEKTRAGDGAGPRVARQDRISPAEIADDDSAS